MVQAFFYTGDRELYGRVVTGEMKAVCTCSYAYCRTFTFSLNLDLLKVWL
jgi:hypothetical protein